MSGSYWLRLDADAPEHPKIIGLNDRAFRLWTRGLCYCARHLTDGEIPAGALATLCPGRGTKGIAKLLVSAALWRTTETGWRVHDWHHYQPAAGAEKARRTSLSEARAAAGRKGAEARWGMAKAMANGWQAPSHDHVHSPDPEDLASVARGQKTFDTSEMSAFPDQTRAHEGQDLGHLAPTPPAPAAPPDPLPTPEAVKGAEPNGAGPGLLSREGPATAPEGVPASTDTPGGTLATPQASGGDLIGLLRTLADEGHAWGTEALARVLERGGRLSHGERRALAKIQAERAAAPSGPRRGVVKAPTSRQPAGGWQPAGRIANGACG